MSSKVINQGDQASFQPLPLPEARLIEMDLDYQFLLETCGVTQPSWTQAKMKFVLAFNWSALSSPRLVLWGGVLLLPASGLLIFSLLWWSEASFTGLLLLPFQLGRARARIKYAWARLHLPKSTVHNVWTVQSKKALPKNKTNLEHLSSWVLSQNKCGQFYQQTAKSSPPTLMGLSCNRPLTT